MKVNGVMVFGLIVFAIALLAIGFFLGSKATYVFEVPEFDCSEFKDESMDWLNATQFVDYYRMEKASYYLVIYDKCRILQRDKFIVGGTNNG